MVNTKFSKYQDVYRDFSKFFDQDALRLQLERKCDLHMFEQLNDSKAAKTSVEYEHSLIENLNERVKHLSIL